MTSIRRVIGTAAIAATSVALTAGPAPASAAPQQSPGVTLGIERDPANDAQLLLTIRGTFPMTEDSARERLNTMTGGGGMDYIVYADDPGENDGPIGIPHGYPGAPGPAGGFVIAVPAGLAFLRQFSVSRNDLDEDICFNSGCDDNVDEIYVKVRFVPGNGAGPLGAYTNAVSGRFGD